LFHSINCELRLSPKWKRRGLRWLLLKDSRSESQARAASAHTSV
jgi:hypothetical protein